MVIEMRSLGQHLMQKFYSCCLIRDFLSTHATVGKRYTFHSEPWRSWRSSGVNNKIWDLPSLYFHPSLPSYFLKSLLYAHLLPSFFLGARSQNYEKLLLALPFLSVCPSTRMEQLRLSMDGLLWNVIFDCFFWLSFQKFEVLTSDKSYFTWRPKNIYDFFLWRCDPTRVMASSFTRFSRSHITTHHSR
jgi:hypothetical protein